MPDLDPVRTPEKPRFFRTLTVGVALVLGLIVSLEWWLANPWPRGVIVVAVSALIGLVVGRVVFRKKMFKGK